MDPLYVRLETDADLNVVAAWLPQPEVAFIEIRLVSELGSKCPLAHTLPKTFEDAWSLQRSRSRRPNARWHNDGQNCDSAGLIVGMKPDIAGAIPTLVAWGAAKDFRISSRIKAMTEPAAATIIEAVRMAQKLKVDFKYHGGGLAPDFFDKFAYAASKNIKLQQLCFQFSTHGDDIADMAASRLGNMLGGHESLEVFSFSGGRLTGGVLTALLESLCENEHIRKINVHSSFPELFGQDIVAEVKHVLNTNYSLVDVRVMKAYRLIVGAVSAESARFFEAQALCGICDDVSTRNRTLWQQRAALQALARFSGYGFATLARLSFRNKILEYFLPVWAAFAPRSLVCRHWDVAEKSDAAPAAHLPHVLDASDEFVKNHDELLAIINAESAIDGAVSAEAPIENLAHLHTDPPAQIDPMDAAEIVHGMWLAQVEQGGSIRHAELDAQTEDSEDEKILLCKLNRNPAALRQELTKGQTLRAVREELEAVSLPWKLSSGCLIFVHPWQYQTAIRSLIGHKLHPDHIVFSATVEHLVEEALQICGNGWVKMRSILDLTQAGSSQGSAAAVFGDKTLLGNTAETQVEWVVVRTFLCLVPRKQMPLPAAASWSPGQ